MLEFYIEDENRVIKRVLLATPPVYMNVTVDARGMFFNLGTGTVVVAPIDGSVTVDTRHVPDPPPDFNPHEWLLGWPLEYVWSKSYNRWVSPTPGVALPSQRGSSTHGSGGITRPQQIDHYQDGIDEARYDSENFIDHNPEPAREDVTPIPNKGYPRPLY